MLRADVNVLSEVSALLSLGKENWYSRIYNALLVLYSRPKSSWFRKSFEVAKASGGFRTITPAGKTLGLVQYAIVHMLKEQFLRGSQDFCYTDRGVLSTVTLHKNALADAALAGRETKTLVFDLKSAFDHVTAASLRNWLRFYLCRHISEEAVEVLVDLVTLDGRTPQGCVSTAYLYNLVLLPFDAHLNLLQQRYPILATTRYSDNICMTVAANCDETKLFSEITKLVHAFGFEVSWYELYIGEGAEYLGTRIFADGLELLDTKLGEYYALLIEAIKSPNPKAYASQIRGIRSWIKHICDDNIPEELSRFFEKYRVALTGQLRLL